MSKKPIRFDWAMKKLLRHKANFGILEGFLSELLRFDVTIESILESEGKGNVAPKQDEYDKYNRVNWINELTSLRNASKIRATNGLFVHIFGVIAVYLLALPTF